MHPDLTILPAASLIRRSPFPSRSILGEIDALLRAAQAWKRILVLEVDGATVTSAPSPTETTVTSSSEAITATAAPTSEIPSVTTAASSAAAITSTPASLGISVLDINIEYVLLLALTLSLRLFTLAGKEILSSVFGNRLHILKFFIFSSFVGLSSLGHSTAKLQLLFRLLSKVVGIRPAIVLRLSLCDCLGRRIGGSGSFGRSGTVSVSCGSCVGGDGSTARIPSTSCTFVFFFGFSDGFPCLFIFPLGFAGRCAP